MLLAYSFSTTKFHKKIDIKKLLLSCYFRYYYNLSEIQAIEQPVFSKLHIGQFHFAKHVNNTLLQSQNANIHTVQPIYLIAQKAPKY